MKAGAKVAIGMAVVAVVSIIFLLVIVVLTIATADQIQNSPSVVTEDAPHDDILTSRPADDEDYSDDYPTEPFPFPFEEYAGDEATCVWVWDNGEQLYLAQENGYYAVVPEGYSLLEQGAEFVQTCKTNRDGFVVVFYRESGDLAQNYIWTVLTSEDGGVNWSYFDFIDGVPDVYGPACRVVEIFYDSEDEMRLITTECLAGDGGEAIRNGYVIEMLDDVTLPLYTCRLTPEAVIHPETGDTLWMRHDEECEILY